MKILGISGIHGAEALKRRQSPGLDDREYRIVQGFDSAAALVIDGEFVAGVAEERISRKKHTGDFPVGAIEACLEQAGIRVDELDEIVHGFDYGPYQGLYRLSPQAQSMYEEVLSPAAFAAQVKLALPAVPASSIHHVDHHLAHAASALYTSGWDECLVIVIDGMGEAHGLTVYRAAGDRLTPVHRVSAADSIGILYSLVTLHLGFDFNSDEYKVMGLAPYGDPARFTPFFEEIVALRPEGDWTIPLLKLDRTPADRDRYSLARRHLGQHLIPAREPDADITAEHQDAAAALQACLDRCLLHVCGHFGRKLGLKRLALAGGVALNTTANARLIEAGLFDEIYVQPAAADDGSSLGAALQRAAVAGEVRNVRSPTPFYGPAARAEDVERALEEFADQIVAVALGSWTEACDAAARLIDAGDVIAVSRGHMEFGPRALGHRSILADPGRADMRDRVNALVKMRESFRPFAPAVSIEQVDRFFEVAPGTSLPYMNVNVSVRPEFRAQLPATTHVDGSSRVQTVDARDNPDFHALLRAVGSRSGREIVLNTSFNIKGQAIVNTPREALETFLGTGIQALLLEDVLVRRA